MPIHGWWDQEVAEATVNESMAFLGGRGIKSNKLVRVLYRERTDRMKKINLLNQCMSKLKKLLSHP